MRADVLYHLIIYLESNDIKIEDVMSELKVERNSNYENNKNYILLL